MNKASSLYTIYWNNYLIGMASVLPLPSGTLKYGVRQHRLVILPDYQGLGFGTKINDFMANYYYNLGYKYFIRTTHIRLGNHLSKRIEWCASKTNEKIRNDSTINCAIKRGDKGKQDLGDKRKAYSFEYVGKDYNIKEHQNIICIGDCSYKLAKQYLTSIIQKDKFPIIISGNAKVENNTIFEQVALDLGIRTEILYVKIKGELGINKSKLKNKFDCICLSEEGIKELKPYYKNMNQIIAYNYKYNPPKLYEKIN